MTSSIQHAPVATNGKARLAPVDRQARMSFRATVEVRIPPVGRKMRTHGTQLMNLLTNEQQFTTRWIAGNH